MTAPPPLPVALRTPTLPPAQHTNCYIIGRSAAVVVDPGSAFVGELERLRRALWRLRGAGGGVQCVLLTHHHSDHISGAEVISRELRVPVAAHSETLSRLPWIPTDVRPLESGSRLEVDRGHELRILHTPGHAPGHVCVHDQRDGTLYAGDMLAGVGTVLIDPGDGDMEVYLDSLRGLAGLDDLVWVLPGHGPAIPPESIMEVVEHRLWREGQILLALAQGPTTVEALTRLAYSDVPPITWPLASRSVLSHLFKLEREGRVGPQGEGWGLTGRPGGERFDA